MRKIIIMILITLSFTSMYYTNQPVHGSNKVDDFDVKSKLKDKSLKFNFNHDFPEIDSYIVENNVKNVGIFIHNEEGVLVLSEKIEYKKNMKLEYDFELSKEEIETTDFYTISIFAGQKMFVTNYDKLTVPNVDQDYINKNSSHITKKLKLSFRSYDIEHEYEDFTIETVKPKSSFTRTTEITPPDNPTLQYCIDFVGPVGISPYISNCYHFQTIQLKYVTDMKIARVESAIGIENTFTFGGSSGNSGKLEVGIGIADGPFSANYTSTTTKTVTSSSEVVYSTLSGGDNRYATIEVSFMEKAYFRQVIDYILGTEKWYELERVLEPYDSVGAPGWINGLDDIDDYEPNEIRANYTEYIWDGPNVTQVIEDYWEDIPEDTLITNQEYIETTVEEKLSFGISYKGISGTLDTSAQVILTSDFKFEVYFAPRPDNASYEVEYWIYDMKSSLGPRVKRFVTFTGPIIGPGSC